jgi:hypothetical protein
VQCLNLLGKDYFTEQEAAHYCCVSLSQFRKRMTEFSIVPGVFMGKKVYRRADLSKAMERSWLLYEQ